MKEKIRYPIQYYRVWILGMGLSATFLLLSVAFCATEDDVNNATGLISFVYGFVDDIFNPSRMADLEDLLVIDFNGTSLTAGGITFTSLCNVMTTINKTFQNFSTVMLVIFFGISFLDGISMNQMYLETIVRKFVFLVAGILLIANSMELVFTIGNMFSVLIQRIVNNANTSTVDMAEGIMELKKMMYDACNVKTGDGALAKIGDSISNTTTAIGYVIQLLIPWAVARFAGVVIKVVCWSRFIELTILSIVSPITICDINDHPANSSAVRGFKNIIALSLSGAIILLSVFICEQIQYGIFSANVIGQDNFASCVWSEVVVAVVEVGLVVKSGGLAKQALGMV